MPEKNKTAVILNATAGKHAGKGDALRAAARILTAEHLRFTTSSIEELEDVTYHIAQEHPDVGTACIMGGDKTASATLTSLLDKLDPARKPPRILQFAGGTMNTVARDLGLVKQGDRPEDIVHRARVIRDKLNAGVPLNVTYRSPLRVNDSYAFLWGAGSVARYLQIYNDNEVRGKRAAIKVITDAILSELAALMPFRKKAPRSFMETVYASIALPPGYEKPYAPSFEHTAIMCSTVRQIGLGIQGMPDADSKVGHFMLRATNLSFWGVAANLPLLTFGLPMMSTFDAVVPEVLIRFEEPTLVMADGDTELGQQEYHVSCGPLLEFIIG